MSEVERVYVFETKDEYDVAIRLLDECGFLWKNGDKLQKFSDNYWKQGYDMIVLYMDTLRVATNNAECFSGMKLSFEEFMDDFGKDLNDLFE